MDKLNTKHVREFGCSFFNRNFLYSVFHRFLSDKINGFTCYMSTFLTTKNVLLFNISSQPNMKTRKTGHKNIKIFCFVNFSSTDKLNYICQIELI